MANQDSGWRPAGGLQQYKGHEVWDYNIGPHEVHEEVTEADADEDD